MSGLTQVEMIAKRAEAYGLVREVRGNRMAWWVDCACGKALALDMKPSTKPSEMVAMVSRKGWSISTKHKPVCQHCQEELKMNKTAQIGPDPKIARKIYAALDDHFDEVKKVYRAGWSDARVANELDVSLEIVVSIRKAAYGELAEDPAVTQLKEDIELTKMMFSDEIAKLTTVFTARLTELEGRLPPRLSKAAG